ncbi:MAG: nucleoside monophosphate kinase [Holosporaceae bacterium]|jgi:adenylate kinase|nr:nucleoside monophosphate kinase [Holosporaceae bacterium]
MTEKLSPIIVLLGAPGAGKGTISQYLRDKYGICHFSTGNLLRNEIQNGSDIGLKVKEVVTSGGLVGDDVINEIVEKNLEETVGECSAVVLDGYPRTKRQAEVLDAMVSGRLKALIRVIEISIDKEALISRLSQRLVCSNCGNTYGPLDGKRVCSCGGSLIKRKDDEESTIRERFKKYEEETLPISSYYGDRLVRVSGNGTPEEVAQNVDKVLCDFGVEKRR